MARLRKEQARQAEWEARQDKLLQDSVQKDVKIAELEAELTQHRQYLELIRKPVF